MAIANRDLEVGTRLVGTYKKEGYVCRVEAEASGGKLAFVLEDGRRFKSASPAASAVIGGKAVNGWLFWSQAEGKAGETTSEAAAPAAKPQKRRKVIYRLPNQQGTPAGEVKFFCPACRKGFLVQEGTTPTLCPQGHGLERGDA